MSNYLFRLELPADKSNFTVAEALEATAEAVHPEPAARGPVMIQSIDKVRCDRATGERQGRPCALVESDWALLRTIWSDMEPPSFPMPLERWRPYLDAFQSSADRPEEWTLGGLQRDPAEQLALRRAAAQIEHEAILKRQVNHREIALRSPLSGAVSELGWLGNSEEWLLTAADLKKLCDVLAIELVSVAPTVPHFVTVARPQCVPAELLALSPSARITYEEDMAGYRGSGTCSAGDYREVVQKTITRQAEGYFTLIEAAQVLEDSRSGLDAAGTVKRFRLAHLKKELPIHQRGSRFPLEVGETIRDFHDLLEMFELDTWLRKSAGYGFPPAQEALAPRYIAGRRLWKLSEAIETVAAMPGFGVSVEALTARVCREATQRRLTLRSPVDGEAVPSDQLTVFLDGYLYPEDFNAWLKAAGFSAPYRLPEDAAAASSAAEVEADRGRRVKRAALIADNVRRWPTIERDLKDAAANGLSRDAKDASQAGWWWEGSAIAWARARAKVQDGAAPGMAGMAGTIHRMRG